MKRIAVMESGRAPARRWLKVRPMAWFFIVAFAAQAQESTQKSDSQDMPEQYAGYAVGPGDVLSIEVFGMTQLSRSVRISNSGRIHIPYVGILSVAGMMADQIEEEVARQLREQQLVKEPFVRVRVVQYNAQPVYVIGAVSTPGQFMINGEMHLLDVISKAGGFTTAAGKEAFLMRRRDFSRPKTETNGPEAETTAPGVPAPTTGSELPAGAAAPAESVRIDIDVLRQGNQPEWNLPLRGGDVFYVPRRQPQFIYIVGEVHFPGAYGLPRQYDHITASRAVSYAGGPLRTAKQSKAFIMRHDKAGGFQGVPFDFVMVIRGKAPDLPMMPDDIIFIPRSIGKTIGYGMLDLVAHLTQQFIIF